MTHKRRLPACRGSTTSDGTPSTTPAENCPSWSGIGQKCPGKSFAFDFGTNEAGRPLLLLATLEGPTMLLLLSVSHHGPLAALDALAAASGSEQPANFRRDTACMTSALQWPQQRPASGLVLLRAFEARDVDMAEETSEDPYIPLIGSLPAHANREAALA